YRLHAEGIVQRDDGARPGGKRWGVIALQMVSSVQIEIAIEHGPVFYHSLRRARGLVHARQRAQQPGPAKLDVRMGAELVGQREDVRGIGTVEKVAMRQLDRDP